MEHDEEVASCKMLKEGLSLKQLIDKGANFEINTDFDTNFAKDIFEELNLGSDDEDDKTEDKINAEELASPWTKPFEELRKQMVQIHKFVYKKNLKAGNAEKGCVPDKARARVTYTAYWEGEGAPFDSSLLRGSKLYFNTGSNEVLEGLEVAVRSMVPGEISLFIISYQLLFREMGCPPRIKPKADGLFRIELISFIEIGDLYADKDLDKEDRLKFSIVNEKTKSVHLKGLDFFSQGSYKSAIRAFEKAVDMLNFCRLSNETEENEQKAFLIKLYTNLAVCYNKVNASSKTCLMCKEITRLTGNNPPAKALFQEGRALLRLGEHNRARRVLKRAQLIQPGNMDINNELILLEQKYTRYKEHEKDIWTKAIGIMKSTEKQETSDDGADTEFEKEILILIEDFKNNKNEVKLTLPSGLTKKEIKMVENLVKKMNMKLITKESDDGKDICVLTKYEKSEEDSASK